MVQMGIGAFRGRLRVISHEIQDALCEQKSRISGQVSDRNWSTTRIRMEGLDPSLSVKNQLTNIDEQMVLLQDEKKGYSAAFGQLIS